MERDPDLDLCGHRWLRLRCCVMRNNGIDPIRSDSHYKCIAIVLLLISLISLEIRDWRLEIGGCVLKSEI